MNSVKCVVRKKWAQCGRADSGLMTSVSLLNGQEVQPFYLVSLNMLKDFSEPQFFHLFYGDNNTCPLEMDTQSVSQMTVSTPTLIKHQAQGSVLSSFMNCTFCFPIENQNIYLPLFSYRISNTCEGYEALIISLWY